MVNTKLIAIAFKNLFRHKVKTIFTLIAIIIGVFIFIWLDGWLKGINMDSVRNLINFESGSSKIYSKGYYEKKDELPLYEAFDNYDGIINKLEAEGYIAAPRVVFSGSIMSKGKELAFRIIGVEPEKEKKIFDYAKYVQAPMRIETAEFENTILANIKDDNDKKYLLETYEKNSGNGYYKVNVEKINSGEKIIKLEKQLEEVNAQLNSGNASNQQLLKIKQSTLSFDIKYTKRTELADTLGRVKKILNKINFQNFIIDGENTALIGVNGASNLDVSEGDSVRILTTLGIKDEKGIVHDVFQVIDVSICGIINSPNPKTNGNILYIPGSSLQGRSGLMLEGRITEICIRKANVDRSVLPGKDESLPVVKGKIKDVLRDDLTLVGWQDDAKQFLTILQSNASGNFFLLFLLFILALFGISNTMLMAIYERSKEIGVLRSIGMRDKEIVRLYMIEGALIGFIGASLGILIGLPVDIFTIYTGIDYTRILEASNIGDTGIRIVGIFKGSWNVSTMVLIGILSTVVSAFAAGRPAKKAMKKSIVATLRIE